MIGVGLMFALGDGRGFLATANPTAFMYAALRTEAEWSSGDITKDALLAEFTDWDDRFLRLVRNAEAAPFPCDPPCRSVINGSGSPASRFWATPTSCHPSPVKAPTSRCRTAPNWPRPVTHPDDTEAALAAYESDLLAPNSPRPNPPPTSTSASPPMPPPAC